MSILKRLLQSVLGQGGSQSATTRKSSESRLLPVPICCACGKELPPGQTLAETFGQAGWSIVSTASPGTGLDAALYTALVCSQCESISCYPCAGFRPDTHPDGPNYSVACPKCGGKVNPLNSDIYRTLLAKQAKPKAEALESHKGKTTVRILIAHTGNNLATSDVREVIRHVWDGQVDPNVKITSHPLTESAWSSDEQFAYAWLTWQQMLQHDGEHPYWEDHKAYAHGGTIARTRQRYYIEIYYKESREGNEIEARHHVERAYEYEEKEDLENAQRECELAIRLAPDWAEAHNLLGIILEELGQKEQAIAAYHRAVHLNPDFHEAQENLLEAEAELRGEGGGTLKESKEGIRMWDNLPGFLQAIKFGPACLHTDILHITECLDTLTAQLREQGQSADEITQLIDKNIRAICPTCSAWTPGLTLSMLGVIKGFGERAVVMGYGDKSRLLEGVCVNHSCGSREILLIWKGSESIEQQILRHLQRVKTNAENKGELVQLRYVEMLSSPEILAFTKDTLFGLGRKAITQHLYIGRRFPNLAVWVSAIGLGRQDVKYAFPKGYMAFLDQRLDESGYSQGDIAVAHWISVLALERFIHLALIPEKNLNKAEGFLILPVELLSSEERNAFGIK